MKVHETDAGRVRALLQDPDLKLVLDSPEGDYRVEYYATVARDADSEVVRPVRAYRLVDRVRGGITQEPWDRFDLDRQTALAIHLMEFGGYRLSKVVAGWSARCPACGHVARGKIWETAPAVCPGKGPRRCRHRYSDEDIVDELRALD
jgi:hypothetical protein